MQKTVLITGASRGIGKACAINLAYEGYNVVVGYNKNKENAEKLCEELTSHNFSAQACFIDVTDVNSITNCIKFTNDTYGKITHLVNNAGISQQIMFNDINLNLWQNMLNTNLTGAYLVTKAVIEEMIKNKYGSIVNISSIWGEVGASCEVHYSTSKGGLIAFTKALAKEVGPSNIRVNCVSPGVIDTDMMNMFSDSDKKALADDIPLCRLGKAEEVAKAVNFLLSENASYITGEVLSVNGGMN